MAAILQSAQWIPPDRDLALRGQIKTGWSTLAARKPNRYVANGTGELTDEELETIQTVISKADVLERKEHIRIGLLSLQYEQLCSNARGNGDTSCIICGYDFVVPKSRVTIQLHICQACTRRKRKKEKRKVTLPLLPFPPTLPPSHPSSSPLPPIPPLTCSHQHHHQTKDKDCSGVQEVPPIGVTGKERIQAS
eukprot:Em0015g203a